MDESLLHKKFQIFGLLISCPKNKNGLAIECPFHSLRQNLKTLEEKYAYVEELDNKSIVQSLQYHMHCFEDGINYKAPSLNFTSRDAG